MGGHFSSSPQTVTTRTNVLLRLRLSRAATASSPGYMHLWHSSRSSAAQDRWTRWSIASVKDEESHIFAPRYYRPYVISTLFEACSGKHDEVSKVPPQPPFHLLTCCCPILRRQRTLTGKNGRIVGIVSTTVHTLRYATNPNVPEPSKRTFAPFPSNNNYVYKH